MPIEDKTRYNEYMREYRKKTNAEFKSERALAKLWLDFNTKLNEGHIVDSKGESLSLEQINDLMKSGKCWVSYESTVKKVKPE